MDVFVPGFIGKQMMSCCDVQRDNFIEATL